MTSPPSPAATIDRYEVRRGLGKGAMGNVYLAYDTKVGRPVAIKVLQEHFARNPKYRQRFEREARAIAALRHPNIIELYDFGSTHNAPMYLVMEYIAGDHLGKVCRTQGPLPESVVLAIGIELAGALSAAHQAGIIHRDLKPENVYLQRGRLILADFGIVKAIDAENPFGAEAASPRTEVIGTPGFMAPEQLEQRPLDARTDIFAAGALLYYLGSGHLPFDGQSPMDLLEQFRSTRPTPLKERQPAISHELSKLLQDCLEYDPDRRPLSSDLLRRIMLQQLAQLGAREVRDVLAEFEQDPAAFREVDKQRTAVHLSAKLKEAVHERRGHDARELQERLQEITHEDTLPDHITGMQDLLQQYPRDTAPEIVLARAHRRSRIAWYTAGLLALAGILGTVSWNHLPALLRSSEATQPVPSPAAQTMLVVRSTHPTQVYGNGKALGQTPQFMAVPLPEGPVVLEFFQHKLGTLRHEINVEPDANVQLVLFVNWRQQTIDVSESPLP